MPIIDEISNIFSVLNISKLRDTESNLPHSSDLLGQFDGCHVSNKSNLLNKFYNVQNTNVLQNIEMCTQKIPNWTERCYKVDPNEPIFSFNVDCLLAKECMCTYDNHAANTVFSLGPYLYPFGIEFSLLIGKAIDELL